MWKLIPQKLMPPTRMVRYCCAVLKETGCANRFIATGVRWAESTQRKDREEFEKIGATKATKEKFTSVMLMNDNVNEFEINGYPKSQKEFKEFISEIVDEDVFNLITNPNAFNALAWKKQREILMKFVGSFSDVDIAEGFGEKYTKLMP